MQKNKELEIDKEKLAAEVRCCLEQHIVELSGQIHQAINQILAEKSCNILQMTVMRADLYQGAPMLAVRGYDERWYLDEDQKPYICQCRICGHLLRRYMSRCSGNCRCTWERSVNTISGISCASIFWKCL